MNSFLTKQGYELMLGSGLLDRAGKLLRPILKGSLAVIITDTNLEQLYAARLARSLHLGGFTAALLEIPAGKENRGPDVVYEIWEQLLDVGLTGEDAVIALGGRTVEAVAGFAAGTLLGGVSFVRIPTTVASQTEMPEQFRLFPVHESDFVEVSCRPAAVLVDPLLTVSRQDSKKLSEAELLRILREGIEV